VKAGPKIGLDAAVIDAGDTCIVAAADPITFIADESGWYCIHVNANDVACMGAVPKWFLITILLPEQNADEETAESIFRSVDRGCREIGISVCGGHTEVTYGIERPVVCGFMIGEVLQEDLVLPENVQEGDSVILTKGAAVEATSIIAREKGEMLKERGYKDAMISKCADYIYNPGISIVKEALIAVQTVSVHGMHDPTEGGVRTGLWELAEASGQGIEVYPEHIFCSEETGKLCGEFEIDPLGAISSGALLIAVSPSETDTLITRLAEEGISAAAVASIKSSEFGRKVNENGVLKDLEYSARDEITKLFE
jgi:hydrogenase maturation factor